MATPEQVRAAAEAHVAAANTGDAAAVAANFSPDAVWYDPVGQPPHEGTDGIRAFFDQTHELADRIEMKLIDVITCGDEAAMTLEIHATFGDSTTVLDCIETLEVGDDGKITRMKAYWDLTRARPRGA
jgi:steroid Delta-isomerase